MRKLFVRVDVVPKVAKYNSHFFARNPYPSELMTNRDEVFQAPFAKHQRFPARSLGAELYGGMKSVDRIKLIPRVSPPDMAMDTFVPVLFNGRFAPFPTMPEHIAYHATYLQLQTQETADGKPCLEGWGRNKIPVDPDQTHDFLTYQGIYNHD